MQYILKSQLLTWTELLSSEENPLEFFNDVITSCDPTGSGISNNQGWFDDLTLVDNNN